MVINAVSFEFLIAEGKRCLSRRTQVTGRIVFVRDHFGEHAAHLQSGRILAGGHVLAFDGLVDTFEAANLKGHHVREFFQHASEMLKIPADKKLRLLGGDIERMSLRVDGVGDFFHGRLGA